MLMRRRTRQHIRPCSITNRVSWAKMRRSSGSAPVSTKRITASALSSSSSTRVSSISRLISRAPRISASRRVGVCRVKWQRVAKLPTFIGRVSRPKSSSSRVSAMASHSVPKASALTRPRSESSAEAAIPAFSSAGAVSKPRRSSEPKAWRTNAIAIVPFSVSALVGAVLGIYPLWSTTFNGKYGKFCHRIRQFPASSPTGPCLILRCPEFPTNVPVMSTESATAQNLPAPERKPLRFITAASLFDGHDAAINIMRRIIQQLGAEVIHLGHNRSVEDVVTAALQEDAHAIALSSYQGGHVEYFKYMVDMLKERGGDNIKVFGGGGGVLVPEV